MMLLCFLLLLNNGARIPEPNIGAAVQESTRGARFCSDQVARPLYPITTQTEGNTVVNHHVSTVGTLGRVFAVNT